MQLHTNNQGFTLIELMIATLVGLMLISAVTATYIVQNRSYVSQDAVSETNTQSKIAFGLIINDIKISGYGVPKDMGTVKDAGSSTINNMHAVVTPFDRDDGPDAITLVGGFTQLGTILPSGMTPGSACPESSEVPADATSFDIALSGGEVPNNTDMSNLSLDGIKYVKAKNVASGGSHIELDSATTQKIPLKDTDGDGICDGRPIYLVEDVTYCVDDNAALHKISRNADPANCGASANSVDSIIAENIEDLQFSYALDINDDGKLDDYNADGTVDFIDGDDFVSEYYEKIRVIRVNILARTSREDLNYQGKGNPPAQIENRNHDQTNDNFRRRWWRSIVKLRNQ